ncbi:MAG: PIN domain-containing protein [Micrococcales bacterium]|nr:PIN domain-containing protein [Micrococcales bacterium]
MKLVDTNVLVYAAFAGSRHHSDARGWLDAALTRGEPVGFAWFALVGFVRLATNPRVADPALTRAGALEFVDAWLGAPSAHVLEAGSRHADFLREMLAATSASPDLVNDAHLAAIAREHKATVITFDSDFRHFPGVRWEQPRR